MTSGSHVVSVSQVVVVRTMDEQGHVVLYCTGNMLLARVFVWTSLVLVASREADRLGDVNDNNTLFLSVSKDKPLQATRTCWYS